MYIKMFFESAGWEVFDGCFRSVPTTAFELPKFLRGLYIRGMK
jgi:hypothetical protein